MALGYSKIISKNRENYFSDWLIFLGQNFNIIQVEGKICSIDQNGEEVIIDSKNLLLLFYRDRIVIVKVLNQVGNLINCVLQLSSDGAYCYEEYTLDQLSTDIEYEKLFSKLNERYVDYVSKSIGIGFLFDKDGYSEDYITLL